jgi:hypothetical protein
MRKTIRLYNPASLATPWIGEGEGAELRGPLTLATVFEKNAPHETSNDFQS